MKRDLDLIRKLLIYFEEKAGPEMVLAPEIEGYDANTIQYQLRLMHGAGLLYCEAERSSTNPERVIRVYPFDLTWEGHEFLKKIQDEGVWRRLKETVKSKGATMTFAVINELATKWALRSLGDA